MYPCTENPTYGIFVQEQESAIKQEFPNIHYTIAFVNGRHGKSEYIKSIFKIRKLIQEQSFDLIHIHYGFSGLFLLLGKLPKKIPVLVTLHGGDIQAEQGKAIQVWFTKQILKKVNAAITLNKVMDGIVKKYVKYTQIIPCSVNTNFFVPSSVPKSTSLQEDLHIIFPSDKNRSVKNYPLFEQTISVLKNRYGIKCHTSEIKNMSREDVVQLYQNANLMIMTSISEGSPQVVKEAMACNLPVISTNVGDVSLLLENVKNSAVSTNMEAEELAELAFKAINNQIKGINGRDKIFQMHIDDQSIAKRIYQVYLSLL